jgi:methionine synthase II (cobalamin-independent)
MAPPFRAEHIGSLMRPADLLAARSAAGVTSSYSQLTEDVQVITAKAIADVVTKQLELGIRPITSGEYERDKFYSGLFENLQGMEVIKDLPITEGYRTNFPTLRTLKSLGIAARDSVVAVDRIQYTKSPYLSEWQALRARLPQEQWKDCKMTMPPITHSHMQVSLSLGY